MVVIYISMYGAQVERFDSLFEVQVLVLGLALCIAQCTQSCGVVVLSIRFWVQNCNVSLKVSTNVTLEY